MNNSNVSLASDSSALVSKDELKVRIEKVRREGKEKKNRKEIVRNTRSTARERFTFKYIDNGVNLTGEGERQ